MDDVSIFDFCQSANALDFNKSTLKIVSGAHIPLQ